MKSTIVKYNKIKIKAGLIKLYNLDYNGKGINSLDVISSNSIN